MSHYKLLLETIGKYRKRGENFTGLSDFRKVLIYFLKFTYSYLSQKFLLFKRKPNALTDFYNLALHLMFPHLHVSNIPKTHFEITT